MATLNSPVRAIRSGIVQEVSSHPGLRRFIELAHRGDVDSLYAHLDTVMVSAGERVRQGQVIGLVGKTGNAKHPWIVPHLHLEVKHHGEPIDPTRLGLEVVSAPPTQEADDAHGGQ